MLHLFEFPVIFLRSGQSRRSSRSGSRHAAADVARAQAVVPSHALQECMQKAAVEGIACTGRIYHL